MVRQTRKPTKSPSDDDWQRVIATFAHYRNLDDTKFRAGVEKLAEQLRNASDGVYKTITRIDREETTNLAEHDGTGIVDNIKLKGCTEPQIALAELDLLRIDRDPPTRAVVTLSPDELGKGPLPDLGDRTVISVDEDEVVRRLRTQAKRLREGAKRVQRRVQRRLDDYKQRRKAIEPATSVAWASLFETTEPWGCEPMEIAERIADGVRHPKMSDSLTRDDHVALWHGNLKTRLSDWRKRRKTSQSTQKRGRKK